MTPWYDSKEKQNNEKYEYILVELLWGGGGGLGVGGGA